MFNLHHDSLVRRVHSFLPHSQFKRICICMTAICNTCICTRISASTVSSDSADVEIFIQISSFINCLVPGNPTIVSLSIRFHVYPLNGFPDNYVADVHLDGSPSDANIHFVSNHPVFAEEFFTPRHHAFFLVIIDVTVVHSKRNSKRQISLPQSFIHRPPEASVASFTFHIIF